LFPTGGDLDLEFELVTLFIGCSDSSQLLHVQSVVFVFLFLKLHIRFGTLARSSNIILLESFRPLQVPPLRGQQNAISFFQAHGYIQHLLPPPLSFVIRGGTVRMSAWDIVCVGIVGVVGDIVWDYGRE
jgi:hypothetical protein